MLARLRERRARETRDFPAVPAFDDWLAHVTPAFNWQWRHLVHIRGALDLVTHGHIDRLMLFVPPRHGKSSMVTVRYPAWRLERDPQLNIICGAYNQTLANRFSRQSRRIVRGRIGLDLERSAVEEWQTARGGTYRAVGVGGGITGVGGDLIVVDDPVKSREEANSPAYREAVWDWYRDDLYTRREPGAAIVLIQCMTGDTPVLMSDGTERPLRDIRAGDRVATYDNGRLGTSTVRNHRSNGPDSIFRIKTTCGKIVHANERHPFLVQEHGQLKWIRLKNLTTDHTIVTVKGNGASGRARHASLMAARNPLAHEAIALSTTEKRCGPMDIVRHRLIQNIGEMCISNSGTESPPRSMTPCTKRKVASALSVVSRQVITCARIGVANCALTTATKRIPSEGFYATTATSLWDTPRRKKLHAPLSNTSDFTLAQIESIVPAGVEEVFDLQIDHTENFIANGLVSHNTRWHEDDLAGRILDSEDGPNWTVISLPAEAEENDPLGRQLGEALCPERYDLPALASIRTVLGSSSYNALYQQRPAPQEGGLIKRHWLSIAEAKPVAQWRIRFWDKAASEQGGAYSAGVKLAITDDGRICVEDVQRGQWSTQQRRRMMQQTAQLDGTDTIIAIEQEPGSSGVDSVQDEIRMLRGYAVFADRPSGDKDTRLLPFAAQAEAGNVCLLQGAWNGDYIDELCTIPYGKYRDQGDATAGAFNRLIDMLNTQADDTIVHEEAVAISPY